LHSFLWFSDKLNIANRRKRTDWYSGCKEWQNHLVNYVLLFAPHINKCQNLCFFLIFLNILLLEYFPHLIFSLSMAFVVAIRVVLFLYIYCSWMLIINAVTDTPFTNKNGLKNLLVRHNQIRRSIELDSNLLEDSLEQSLFSSNIERRNVIMPRICYFVRISGTSSHQRVCLPYNDNKRSLSLFNRLN